MAYVDSLISTGVDQLINLVYRQKRVTFEDASRELGIAQKVIEEWSRILEDEGLVRIDYKFTTAYLVWAGKEVEEPKSVAELRERKESMLREVEGLSSKVEGLLAESRASEKRLSEISKEISRVNKGVQVAVSTIAELKREGGRAGQDASRMISQLESAIESISAKMKGYDRLISESEKSLKADVSHVNSHSKEYSKLLTLVQAQLRAVGEQKELLDKAHNSLMEKEKGIMARMDTYSQISGGKMNEQISAARKEFEGVKGTYEELQKMLEQRLGEMRLALKTVEQFSKDVEALESKISEDAVSRRYSEIKNIMELLSGLQEDELRLDKKLKLLIKELRGIKVEVRATADKEVEEKVEEAKGKIKAVKREVTLLEQKRQELLGLMKRIKDKDGK